MMSCRKQSGQGYILIVALGIGSLTAAADSRGDVFSVDLGSPSGSTVDPADILNSGPGAHVPRAALGLQVGDNLDALSGGLDIVTGRDVIYFSIDSQSDGVQGPFSAYNWDAFAQAILNQQAGDIFVTTNAQGVQSAPQGINYLDVNQHQFGLVPLGSPFPPFYNNQNGQQDNLDAYSMEEFNFNPGTNAPEVPVYFSLASGSPTVNSLGASPADILVYDPNDPTTPLKIAFSRTAMGLQATDDIDALALDISPQTSGPRAYFSLARGSATLSGLGASAADIFYTEFSGGSSVLYTAADLGLAGSDNVDALETNAVPEPCSLGLLLGSLVLAARGARGMRISP